MILVRLFSIVGVPDDNLFKGVVLLVSSIFIDSTLDIQDQKTRNIFGGGTTLAFFVVSHLKSCTPFLRSRF